MHCKDNSVIDSQVTLNLFHIFHLVTNSMWQQVDRGGCSAEEEEREKGYLFALLC